MRAQNLLTLGRQPLSRILVIAAMLILTIGTSQLTLAQEGSHHFVTHVVIDGVGSGEICVGDSKSLQVSVVRTLTTADDPNISISRRGVYINATTSPSGIVSLLQTRLNTAFSEDSSGGVQIDIRGTKAGTTNVVFTTDLLTFLPGEIATGSAGTNKAQSSVTLKVVDCKIEVSMHSDWFVTQGTGGSIALDAVFNKAVMTKDDKDHYTGSAKLVWSPRIVLPPACTHVDTIAETDVKLTGDMNKDNLLVVTLTFATATLKEKGACSASSSINTASQLSMKPLKVIMPFHGGVVRKSQSLRGIVGTASIFMYYVGSDGGQ